MKILKLTPDAEKHLQIIVDIALKHPTLGGLALIRSHDIIVANLEEIPEKKEQESNEN
jgi:hypothetical protein